MNITSNAHLLTGVRSPTTTLGSYLLIVILGKNPSKFNWISLIDSLPDLIASDKYTVLVKTGVIGDKIGGGSLYTRRLNELKSHISSRAEHRCRLVGAVHRALKPSQDCHLVMVPTNEYDDKFNGTNQHQVETNLESWLIEKFGIESNQAY